MAQELVIAMKDIKEIHLIKTVDVVVNVNKMMIALILLLVFEINVSILALVHVELMQSVQFLVMYQDALVLLVSVEMQCSIVEKNQELHHLVLIHAFHLLADLSHNVVKSTIKEFALVYLDISALHLIVDLNVLLILNVHHKWLV